MKKTGLTFLAVLFAACMMVEAAEARWHGHYRGWGPGIYLGVPIVLGPLLYPYRHCPAPPVVIRQPAVYEQPPQEENINYWYYCENPKGYYPYVNNCPSGWMKVLPDANPQTDSPN